VDVYQRRRLVALSAVVGVFVLIVVIASAGGGDDEEPAPVATLTGATGATAGGVQPLANRDYIDQADAICTEAVSSLEAIDSEDLAEAAQREARIMASQLRGLRELPPPERDRNLANSFLGALNDQVRALRDRQLALERDDGDALVEIDARVAEAEAEAQAAAEEFGFEVCGNPEATATGAEAEGVEAPVEPAPVEPAPVEPAPVEPAPVEPAPVEPGTDPGTGGVTPGGGGTGGVSP
jgi:hypothetical protein